MSFYLEIRKSEIGFGNAGSLVAADFAFHFPGHRLRHIANRQIADKLEFHIAGCRRRKRQPFDLFGDEFREREIARVQHAHPQKIIAAVFVALQRPQIHSEP